MNINIYRTQLKIYLSQIQHIKHLTSVANLKTYLPLSSFPLGTQSNRIQIKPKNTNTQIFLISNTSNKQTNKKENHLPRILPKLDTQHESRFTRKRWIGIYRVPDSVWTPKKTSHWDFR